MKDMSEREYSAHSGLSRGAIQKKKGTLVDRARAETNLARTDRSADRGKPFCSAVKGRVGPLSVRADPF